MLYEQSPPAMVLILDYLAENPDGEVTSDELVEVLKQRRADANSSTLAGTLGAFGRRVANRYGMEGWPFDASYSHEHHETAPITAQPMGGATLGRKTGG